MVGKIIDILFSSPLDEKWEKLINEMDKDTKSKLYKENFYEFYYCTNCYFFDGYDMCCHKKNFGSIVDSKIALCKKLNLYKYGKS